MRISSQIKLFVFASRFLFNHSTSSTMADVADAIPEEDKPSDVDIEDEIFTMEDMTQVSVQDAGGNTTTAKILIRFVDGVRYFHLSKSNTAIKNLLQYKCGAQGKLLSKTDIIEAVHAARDKEWKRQLEAVGVSVDRDLRYTNSKVRGKLLTIPMFAPVDVKGYGEIEGISMNVLMEKPTRPLYVELNNKNLRFLTDVIAAQYKDGSIHRKHPREVEAAESGAGGISECYSGAKKGCIRVTYTKEDGSKGNHYEKKTCGVAEARDRAEKFLRSRSSLDVAGADGGLDANAESSSDHEDDAKDDAIENAA